MKLKIAVFFDANKDGGGGYYQSLAVSNSLNKLQNEKFQFIFICTDKENQKKLIELGLKTEFYSKKNLSRKYYKLINSPISRYLFKLLRIKNPFNNFLIERNFDLIIFLGPSFFIQLCESINFITTIYDINHVLENYFPEYKDEAAHLEKNNIIVKSTERAFKILVDTERTAEEIKTYFRCKDDKLIVQPFTTYLPTLYEQNFKNLNFEQQILNIGLNLEDKFLFYPAQFWPHKNHKYILDSLKILKDNNVNLKVVFSGSNKGNFEYLKKIIKNLELNNQVTIFPFLKEEEIISLYKYCTAVVMSTYVARSTLPLYESFYFKKPIFYSKGILDEKLEKFVIPFDLDDPSDLSKKIIDFLKQDTTENKLSEAKKYYELNCNEKNLMNNYRNVLNKYLNLKSIWKS